MQSPKEETPEFEEKQFGWKISLHNFAITIMKAGTVIFALMPFTKYLLINQIYASLWIGEIFVAVLLAIKHENFNEDFSLAQLMSWLLFLTQIGAHLTVILESISLKLNVDILTKKFEYMKYFNPKRKYGNEYGEDTFHIGLLIITIIITLMTFHSTLAWTLFYTNSNATELFWYSLPSTLALQFKVLQIIVIITSLNYKANTLRRGINVMGERNLRRVFKLPQRVQLQKQPKSKIVLVLPATASSSGDDYEDESKDERQLNNFLKTYTEIHECFKLLNGWFGWSLLAFTIVYFIDFVSNLYWIILALITRGRDNYAFIQNGVFLMLTLMMLSTLCWKCQKSYNYSRQIGCLIFKLVKPLGNKRYNDLVTEFSLQTLHQRFVITAKEFFNLNLNLLGSMVAAIVTYLVILIQFMYAETPTTEHQQNTITTATTVLPTNATIITEENQIL